MDDVLLGKHTRREFRQRMDSGELQACIIPIAAIEQHLEHLAMEHDWRSAQLISRLVAERLKPRVLVSEAIMAGVSEHHMVHRGTITISPGTFISVLNDVIDSMVRAGFQNILVLNGHGGNIVPCQAIWDQFLRRFQVNLHFLPYWEVLTAEDGAELMRGGHVIPSDLPGHAQEFETSFALAAFPENVRQDARADQADSRPALAESTSGKEFIERIVDRVSAYVSDMMEGRRVQEVPPFHP